MTSARFRFSILVLQATFLAIFTICVAIFFVFLSPIFLITITQLIMRTLLGLKKRAVLEGRLPLAFMEGVGLRAILSYSFTLCLAGIAFAAIIKSGNQLLPPSIEPLVALTHLASDSSSALLHQALVTLLVVISLGKLFGHLISRAGQPHVIGEILAGIVLGPSVLGAIAPVLGSAVMPSSVAPVLYVLSNIGITIFMFDVGLKLNGVLLKHRFGKAFMISQMSIIAPMVIGAGLALLLYPIYGPKNVSFLVFALFVGVAMSVTAFPVLARILADRGMLTTPLGSLALSCAAADDVAAWCLLAIVVGLTTNNLGSALITLSLTIAFVLILIGLIRPLILFLLRRANDPALTRTNFTLIMVAIVGSALMTDLIGVHAILGAFMFGAIIPSESRIAREFGSKATDLISVLFLPAFFAYTGMRTQIGILSNVSDLWFCGLIICAATFGKFGGSFITARIMGLGLRDSAALGALLNTRGLMELVVLNIGLDFGIISPTLFSAMVIMALLTTFATAPALDLFLGRDIPSPTEAAA